MYRFLKNEVRPRQMQFIPCVEPSVFESTAPQKWDPASIPIQDSSAARPGTPDSVVTDWSIDPDDWGSFLCKIWDEWYRKDIGKVFINHFETAVAQRMGKDSQLCIYHEFCGKGVALGHVAAFIAAIITSIPNTDLEAFSRHPVHGWFSQSSNALSE